MTLDQEPADRDIIEALKSDARSALPAELDQRVAARLAASAGIFGLGTAVSAGSQAAAVASSTTAASTTAVSGAAVASIPALKLVTLGSLAKTLALGMALGSTVGLGLHVSFQHLGKPAAPSRPVAAEAALAPIATTTPAAPRLGVLTEPRDHEAASAPPPLEPPRVAPAGPRANPSPELPSALAPSFGGGLAAQQALLDDARAALRRGDGSGALAAVRRHAAQFPSTAFEEEREAVAIKALVLVGQTSEARARTERFDARFPRSLLTPSLRAEVAGKRAVDSVTKSAPSSQTTSKQ